MKNSCGSYKHMRAVDGKQDLQFHWPNRYKFLPIKDRRDGVTISVKG